VSSQTMERRTLGKSSARITRGSTSKRDGQHLPALMESDKGMLLNGATPDIELVVIVSADQISWMQDVKKSSKRDGQHMPALMESAKGMLSNGATPDVELAATVSADQSSLMQDVKKSIEEGWTAVVSSDGKCQGHALKWCKSRC